MCRIRLRFPRELAGWREALPARTLAVDESTLGQTVRDLAGEMGVAEQLHLDVPGGGDVPLQVHPRILERRLRLGGPVFEHRQLAFVGVALCGGELCAGRERRAHRLGFALQYQQVERAVAAAWQVRQAFGATTAARFATVDQEQRYALCGPVTAVSYCLCNLGVMWLAQF